MYSFKPNYFMKTKLALFFAVLAVALFGTGCGSTETSTGAVDPLKRGLMAHFTFSGNSQDESGNGNHGGVNGAKLTNDRYGKPNCAYAFDGDDNIIITENNSFEGDAHTLSLWINSQRDSEYTHDSVLIAKDGESRGGRQWQIYGKRDKRVGTVLWGGRYGGALAFKISLSNWWMDASFANLGWRNAKAIYKWNFGYQNKSTWPFGNWRQSCYHRKIGCLCLYWFHG